MSDTMKELLVKQQDSVKNKVIGYTCVALAVISLLCTFLVSPFFIAAVIAFPIVSYFMYFRRMSVEYEYTYLDKEIRIDRIYNYNNRKQVEVLDISKIEILAVRGSEALRSFERREATVTDYSEGNDSEYTKVYEVWYEGKRKILLSLEDDFLVPIIRFIPNKVKKQ